jgi:hypothetical protein
MRTWKKAAREMSVDPVRSQGIWRQCNVEDDGVGAKWRRDEWKDDTERCRRHLSCSSQN